MKTKRIGIFLLLAVLILSMGGLCAFAEAETGHITVEVVYEGKELPGMHFALYQIAAVDEQENILYTDEVKALPLTLPSKLSEIDEATFQSMLTGLVSEESSLTPTEEGDTNAAGRLPFAAACPRGLYLIIGDKLTLDEKIYTPLPAIVMVPMLTDNPTALTYELLVRPKISVEDSPVTIQITKRWVGDKESERPESVKVDLLKDGVVEETVSLSAPTWSYTWTELERGCVWNVREQVPDGYTVSYSTEGNVTTITNTQDTQPPSPTPKTPPSKLPQTGVLWWPIPVAFALGILLVLFGVVLRKHEKN